MYTPRDIASLYFRYKPVAGHVNGCSYFGTNIFEISKFQYESFEGQIKSTAYRLFCPECGVIHFEMFDGDASTETTHANKLGYGSRPQQMGNLWLWPGPPVFSGDDRGPAEYYVTTTNKRPEQTSDVAGMVGWALGQRGAVKWGAGVGCTRYGTAQRAAKQRFSSRRAAVKWIAEQLNGEGKCQEDTEKAAVGGENGDQS